MKPTITEFARANRRSTSEGSPRFSAIIGATALLLGLSSISNPARAAGAVSDASVAAPALDYPAARRSNQVDTYHGIEVADPYRWMEDVDSPETRAWVEAEARLTSDYLGALPGREKLVQRLTALWNYERWSPPQQEGGRWFYTRNDGLQNQSVLFTTPDPNEPGHVLIDPNSLSKDGTISLSGTGYSHDGRLLAYALSDAGSDWMTWRIRDITTGRDLPDEIRHAKFSVASWLADGSGFYYAGYETGGMGESLKAQNKYHTCFFHRLGTPQSEDRVIYRRTDDVDWGVGGTVTDDGRYLIVTANHGTDVRTTLLVQDLASNGALKPVIAEPRADNQFIGNIGTTLYVQTDDDAPRYRVVAIDLAHPDRGHWKTIMPQSPDTLVATTLVGHQLIAQYLEDAHSIVRRYTPGGQSLGDVSMPGLGTATGFAGHDADLVTYFDYTDFTTPRSVYRLDLATAKVTPWRTPHLADFRSADYETKQVFFTSKDGMRVPMFVTARKGTRLDGRNPTTLYGYGGFNASLQPQFSPAIANWIELGGVYAVANLRGGGEYGRGWHEAGIKTHKQQVFDDFIAAAEYLVGARWTSRERLAIRGASNGGLLIGAVEEQRPELFAAAVAQVGVMDMLRFREFTVGKAWESDYGSVDDAPEFKALLAYSPYHNVRPGVDYPSTLILTGDHDDRVFPAHSFKFAAAMQHADPNGRPILIRIDLRTGHGSGKPLSKQVEEQADIAAFMLHAMHLDAQNNAP